MIERPRHPLRRRAASSSAALPRDWPASRSSCRSVTMAGNGSCRRSNRSMARLASATSGAERSRSPYCRAKPPASSSALRSRKRETERRRQLQQDVAAARRLAGLDIAQMLDRDAGLERQIGLAHGAAVAPAAQEVADGIDRQRRMLARVHAPIMRRGGSCKPQVTVRWVDAKRYRINTDYDADGYRFAPPILQTTSGSPPSAASARRSGSSAGKKVSSASSCSVMSTGVPNTMVVEMKLSTSSLRRSLKGIATLSAETGPERAGIR